MLQLGMSQIDVQGSFILGCGTAHPPTFYTQQELAAFFHLSDKAARFFTHPHIKTRPLALPSFPPTPETTGALRERSQRITLELATQALTKACQNAQVNLAAIDCLVVVTSTIFITPGLSARLTQELPLKSSLLRLDVVGMGCNAGLNAQAMLDSWCQRNPGKLGAMVCSEASSAIYDTDDSEQTALANSLFSDGAAAIVMSAQSVSAKPTPQFFSYSSHLIPNTLSELRFDWSDQTARFRFVIEKRVPQLLAQGLTVPLTRALAEHQLTVKDVDHWVVHAGGAAMLSAVESAAGCAPEALTVARDVLEKYGNLSSASYLFSYESIIARGGFLPGDVIVLLTMGPGLSIEIAIGRLPS